jgi:hypothetical protein
MPKEGPVDKLAIPHSHGFKIVLPDKTGCCLLEIFVKLKALINCGLQTTMGFRFFFLFFRECNSFVVDTLD